MIRLAVKEDIPQLLYLGEVSCNEITDKKFSYHRAQNYILSVLDDPERFCPLVSIVDSNLSGYLVGSLEQDAYTESLNAVEHHWYIHQLFRNSSDSFRLLGAFEWWAEAKGATGIYLSSGVDPRLQKYLERRGYKFRSNIMEKVI